MSCRHIPLSRSWQFRSWQFRKLAGSVRRDACLYRPGCRGSTGVLNYGGLSYATWDLSRADASVNGRTKASKIPLTKSRSISSIFALLRNALALP
jgi:hypothetical protein